MIRVIILAQSFIIMGLALLAFILIQDSQKLKDKVLGKLIVLSLMLLSVVTFLFSFDTIRYFLARLLT